MFVFFIHTYEDFILPVILDKVLLWTMLSYVEERCPPHFLSAKQAENKSQFVESILTCFLKSYLKVNYNQIDRVFLPFT
jgi:hypothetical protein